MAWATGAARFALLRPASALSRQADPDARAYLEVLGSVELPAVELSADAPSGVLGGFSGLIVPAKTARAMNSQEVQRIEAAVRRGALLITEADTPLARALGLEFASEKILVRQIENTRYPRVAIAWEKPGEAAHVRAPVAAQVLDREKTSGAPLTLIFRHGRGRVLYLAAELDPVHGEGYARFPYFVQALVKDCGVRLPFRRPRLHAFFDYGYRESSDPELLARRWRQSGIVGLHIGAWDFFDREKDDYLRRLIAACHRNGILVWAWFELPHVTERFWKLHPEWREKTASLEDAHVDWRKLINLLEPAAFQAVSRGILGLLRDFDWDGVNIAELYFEPPDGATHPRQFTPMNARMRAEFRAANGWDPLELFDRQSAHHWEKDATRWQKFVEFRIGLGVRLHEQVLAVIEQARRSKPYLDVVVTYLDNLYDPRMREAVASDVLRILPLEARFHFTLVLEDPYTLWSLGPSRYRVLGERYRAAAPQANLGLDINVVERYSEVFPTLQQTGSEFLQLFHNAAQDFSPVLVYDEHSIYPQDLELVSAALAAGAREVEGAEGQTVVESGRAVIFRPSGAGSGKQKILVDGALWPAGEGDEVSLPAGRHTVEVRPGKRPSLRLDRFSGELLSAAYEEPAAISFRYRSQPRALALFSNCPRELRVDGGPLQNRRYSVNSSGACTVLMPPGEHQVRASGTE